jgi:hypothetical protein
MCVYNERVGIIPVIDVLQLLTTLIPGYLS